MGKPAGTGVAVVLAQGNFLYPDKGNWIHTSRALAMGVTYKWILLAHGGMSENEIMRAMVIYEVKTTLVPF